MSGADTRQPVVLLDLDNTILDFNHAERVALGRAFAQLGLEMNDDIAALYHKINIRHWEMLEDGILTREQFDIVGEFHHGTDGYFDLAKPIVSGKEQYVRIAIRKRKNGDE